MAKPSPIIILLCLLYLTSAEEWFETGNPHFLVTTDVGDTMRDPSSIKVLKFFSPWCKYCRYIKAYMENYRASHEVSPNLKFYEFNCQANGPQFCAQEYQVYSYPAVVFYDENGQQLTRLDGLYPEDVVYSILDEMNNRAKLLGNQGEKDPAGKSQSDNNLRPNQQNQQNKAAEPQKDEQKAKQQQKQPEVAQPQKQQEPQKHQDPPTEAPAPPTPAVPVEQAPIQQPKPSIKPENKPSADPPVAEPQPSPQPSTQPSPQPSPQASPREVKVQRSMVQQSSLEQKGKPHPENPNDEAEIVPAQAPTSSHIAKYIIYGIGIAIGLAYAYKMFTGKGQQEQTVQGSAGGDFKATPRDVESEIMVEQVPDENL